MIGSSLSIGMCINIIPHHLVYILNFLSISIGNIHFLADMMVLLIFSSVQDAISVITSGRCMRLFRIESWELVFR